MFIEAPSISETALHTSMSWLLDAELPLYDWSNSYHSTTPSESHMTLTPAFSFMNSSANIVAPTGMTSSILPPLANHGKMVGTSQQRKSGAADAFSPSNCVRPILTQAVARRSLEADSELSNQTVSVSSSCIHTCTHVYYVCVCM